MNIVCSSEDKGLRIKTRGNSDPHGKPKIYFACHPKDFEHCFEEIAADMAKTAAELAKTGDKNLLGKLLYEAAAVGRDLGADPADYFNMIVEASGVKEADK